MSADIYFVVEHIKGEVAEMSYLLAAAARTLAEATGGKSFALLLTGQNATAATSLKADELLVIEHPALAEFTPEAYVWALRTVVEEREPRAVLFGDTTIGAGIAGQLSIRLDLPLVSSCRTFSHSDGEILFVSQICGGKALAEGVVPEPSCLVTMVPGAYRPEDGMSETPPLQTALESPSLESLHTALLEYIEPESGEVDISKESILVAAGRGIQREDSLELLNELAEALGGAVCASRPVVDQNWLSTSRLVGKSGKSVKPKLYLALGVSGAPEHVEGIAGSDLIVAINTDGKAPIFDIAHYGAEVDLLDLVPELTQRIRSAKGG